MYDSNDVQVLENVVNVTIGDSGSFNFTDEDNPNLAADLARQLGKATLSVGAVSSSVVADILRAYAKKMTALVLETQQKSGKQLFDNLSAHFDFEATPEVTFVATVVDGGGLSCSTFVTVHVIDVNEAPFFDSENDRRASICLSMPTRERVSGLLLQTIQTAKVTSMDMVPLFTPSLAVRMLRVT